MEVKNNPFSQTSNPQYSEFIYKSRYARWNESKKRRENWDETVTRYIDFFKNRTNCEDIDWDKLYYNIYNLKVMPSMRALMTAGKALERDNVASYNCAFLNIDDLKAFDEMLYILACGTGVGFSVERQFIKNLPTVSESFVDSNTIIEVPDSKIGWATSFRELIALLYSGKIPKWDMRKVRKAGEKLKTFGGRASGPEPLNDLFKFTVNLIKNAAGRKLNSIECHDLCCKVAEIIVVGGVRRSALISLSNLSDDRMRVAKSGAWWENNVQRALANNSVCYTEKPEMDVFIKEWLSLYESKSGERGIYNRVAAYNLSPERRKSLGYTEFGCNPCSEITLRSNQFCNLSEVVIRADDTEESLLEKIEIATILGTLQATVTDFRYLRKIWKTNCEEERLLGVSLTGIMDNPITNGTHPEELKVLLTKLKEKAVETNIKYSKLLNISPATAITCTKPSGTVSQLVDSASGIHPRYAKTYIRTVRGDKKDPLSQFIKDSGIYTEDDVTKTDSTFVFSFPIKAPESSVFRDDRTAIEQLELWKTYQLYYCEHKPSITVYVKEHEWLEIAAWVYKNFDILSGVSFLPHSDHSYRQAPYQEINEDEYNKFVSDYDIELNWINLQKIELEDNTTNTKELACSAGVCEL